MPANVQLNTPLQPTPELDSVTVSVFSEITFSPDGAVLEAVEGVAGTSSLVTVVVLVVLPHPVSGQVMLTAIARIRAVDLKNRCIRSSYHTVNDRRKIVCCESLRYRAIAPSGTYHRRLQ